MRIDRMVFLDSNVLVYYFISSVPQHERAVAFLNSLLDNDDSIVISPQVIMESFRAMTHEKIFHDRVNASQFQAAILDFISDPASILIGPTRKAVEYALETAAQRNITSSTIYDYLLYGTMREHGISKLATFNSKHFTDLDGIELVSIP